MNNQSQDDEVRGMLRRLGVIRDNQIDPVLLELLLDGLISDSDTIIRNATLDSGVSVQQFRVLSMANLSIHDDYSALLDRKFKAAIAYIDRVLS